MAAELKSMTRFSNCKRSVAQSPNIVAKHDARFAAGSEPACVALKNLNIFPEDYAI